MKEDCLWNLLKKGLAERSGGTKRKAEILYKSSYEKQL